MERHYNERSHGTIARMLVETNSIFRMDVEGNISVVVTDHSYKVLIPPVEEWKEHTEFMMQKGWITCYANGWVSRKVLGSNVYLLGRGKSQFVDVTG